MANKAKAPRFTKVERALIEYYVSLGVEAERAAFNSRKRKGTEHHSAATVRAVERAAVSEGEALHSKVQAWCGATGSFAALAARGGN